MKYIKILIISILLLAIFPINAFAASASFSVSGGGNITTGQNVSVTVSANGSEAYNAITVNVNYSNLSFVSASANSSWTAISGPTNNGSSVSFSGTVLGSSFTGSKTVLTLNFKANTTGKATISPSGKIVFISNSNEQVQANGNTATYTVSPPPTATPAPKPLPSAVTVSSSSHPDQNIWYKNKTADLAWNKDSEVSDFSYIMDQSPATNPDDTSEGSDIVKKYDNLPEGANYFHIKSKNTVGWGPVSHFKLNIDTSGPDPFTITVKDNTTEYLAYFATSDSISGISKYNITVDGIDNLEQKSGYKFAKSVGVIEVTAFDLAGNTYISKMDLKSSNAVIEATQTPGTIINTTAKTDNLIGTVGFVFLGLFVLALIYGGTISYLYWKKLK